VKNALILHGTDANSSANWFPWLKRELEQLEYKVWVPDLPHAEKPNIERYNSFLLSKKDWVFDSDSVIIGHSSGAVEILGLLQALPEKSIVNKCILVGSFRDDLGWDSLKELFIKPFDFEKIKGHARKFIFIHSDNDPYCPLEHAEYLSHKLNGKLILIKGRGHFSGENVEIPEILEELK
jgi:predicted alpha/beta hydrolase family esterase